MAACLHVGCTPKPHCLRLTLPPKSSLKSYQLQYFTRNKIRAFSFLNVTQPTKFRTSTIGFETLNQPQIARQALAAVTNALLEVSDEGDDNQSKLAIESFRKKMESLLEKGKMAVEFSLKFLFWLSLASSSVFSLPLASFAAFLLTGTTTGDDVKSFVRIGITNLCGERFTRHIFSVAFGDGDPNQGMEEKKWKLIGQYIALNGGVVTAEEIAPYLDPYATEDLDAGSYMRPVLLKFCGQPITDEEGNILYNFPSLQCVGQCADCDIEVQNFLKEEKWKFRLSATGIGIMDSFLWYNLFCAIIVSELLRRIGGSSLPILSNAYFCVPLLRVYVMFASSFFAIKTLREGRVENLNFEILKRNELREWYAKELEEPDQSLKRKLVSARAMAGKSSIGNDKFIFRSERDLYELNDSEKFEWDRRFNERCDFVSV